VKRLVLFVGVVAAVLLQPSPASAAWQSEGQARVTATATQVEKATAPTVVSVGSTVDLTWAPVTLKTGQPATGYVVLRDVGPSTTEVCSTSGARSCTDVAPVAGAQTYRIRARFGPWTGPSSAGTTYTPDTQPPTTTATPNGPGWVTTSPVRVTLTATDSGSGVASVSYRIASGPWTNVTGAVAAFDVTGQGTKTITYRATDNVGNVEADRILVLNVDSIAPNAPTGLRLGSDSGASASDGVTNVSANRVLGSGSAAATVEIRRGGTVIATGTVSAAGTFDVPVTLASGAQSLSVRLVDQAGNASAEIALVATLDQTAPVVTPKTPNLQNENKWDRVCEDVGLQPGLCGTVTDATTITQVHYEVRYTSWNVPPCWDGNRWWACGSYRTANGTSPWSVPLPWDDLFEGNYHVRIRATDLAGNTNDTASATYTFIVP
jgi:Bacterial Ig-like domain